MMPVRGFLVDLRHQWRLLVLRGILAVVLGIVAFAWPGVTVLALATLWGLYALVDGIVALITAVRVRDEGRPVWPMVLIGLVGIAAGGFSIARPGVTALVILLFIAAWAIVIGIMQLALAIRLRREIEGEWLLGLSGVLSVLFGAAAIANPGWGATAAARLIGAYTFLFGLLIVVLGFRLRALGRHVTERFAALILLALLGHGCSAAKEPAITEAPTGAELPGKFVWHDLLTGDPAAAQRFYGGLFGWEFRQSDSGNYMVVTQAGRPIGGILDTRDGKAERVPAQWLGSLSVPNVDSAVGVIKAGGGKVHWGPKSLGPRGEVALVADAQNAPFVVMRAPQGDPPDTTPAVDGWLWNELWTPDPEAAVKFYNHLASYEVKPDTGADRAYYVLEAGGRPRAGVTRLRATDVKPNWLPYVRVTDVNATVGRVQALGGHVLIAPTPKIRDGRVALIQDPTGAAVAIQEWEPKP